MHKHKVHSQCRDYLNFSSCNHYLYHTPEKTRVGRVGKHQNMKQCGSKTADDQFVFILPQKSVHFSHLTSGSLATGSP